MTRFWSNWLALWCASVAVFGVVLMTGAFAETDAAIRILLDRLNGAAPLDMTQPLRFSLALMGAVTLGWSVTLLATVRAALILGDAGAPVWRLLTASAALWYIVDSCLSVATGFALNVVPNTIYLAAFLLPMAASGVWQRPEHHALRETA